MLDSPTAIASNWRRLRAAGAHQGEFAAVTLDRAEGRQIGETKRQQRARDREHDEKRLRVERIARRRFQPFGEVVDELDLAGEAAFERVANLAGTLEGFARRAAEAGAVNLRLHLPLDAGEGARDRRGGRAGGAQRRQRPADRPGEGRDGHDRDIGRWLGRRRADLRVERLEEDVGGADEGDAADGESLRRRVGAQPQVDRVADPRPQRRRQLLIEHDLPRPQPAAQEAEGVDVAQVAGWHREDRAGPCVGDACCPSMTDPRKGGGGDGEAWATSG